MWKPLTIDDLKSALNSEELETYSTHAADAGVPDRAPEILEQVVAQVRADIASCTRNRLSRDETLLPEGFHAHALAIARYRLLATLPYMEISEARTEEYRAALKFFDSVATCKRRPEAPADARENEAASEMPLPGAQVVHSRPDITGRANLSGL